MTFSVNQTNGEIFITGLKEGKYSEKAEIEIPEKIQDLPVTEISSSAFASYTQITSVQIRAKVRVFRSYSFASCQNLITINIPSSTTTLENNVFDDCFKLKNVAFDSPYSITFIGIGAFNTCKELQEIYIPSTVKYIGYLSFTEISNITVKYCGREKFPGILFDSQITPKIIVPSGGTRTFGGRKTVFGDVICSFINKEKTCSRKRTFSMSLAFCVFLCA